jgi:ribulose 1,5-bisphosphate carboxylase large subunit-like protein
MSHPLYIKLQRTSGADMVMLPGAFAADGIDQKETGQCVTSCLAPMGNIKPVLPIIAGGKHPGGIKRYLDLIGSAATAVDSHPDGIEAGKLILNLPRLWTESQL